MAEVAGVAQTTVSRWEAGEILPPEHVARQVMEALTRPGAEIGDTPLRRMIEATDQPVHLVGDNDHRLLAASPGRLRQWGVAFSELQGCSLWPFASVEVMAAEASLGERGWWDEQTPSAVTVELVDANHGLRFVAGRMMWERLHLADGSAVRLCLQVA